MNCHFSFQDDALLFMNSEEELKNILIKVGTQDYLP